MTGKYDGGLLALRIDGFLHSVKWFTMVHARPSAELLGNDHGKQMSPSAITFTTTISTSTSSIVSSITTINSVSGPDINC